MLKLNNNNEPRLLLVDGDCGKRKLRATVFRNREIAIEAVGSAREAVSALTVQRFDLVLLETDQDKAIAVCSQLRKIAPHQRVALLVGPPDYVRDIPRKTKVAELAFSAPRLQLVEPQDSSLALVS